MNEPEQLIQLKEMLSSNLLRKRRAGIEMAGVMLVNDVQREEVRVMLANIAKNDLMLTLQEAAQATLDADDTRRNPPQAMPPDYVFGARCSKGHISYYDKREYCGRQSYITRHTISHDGKDVDEVLLTCKTKDCGEQFFVEVDCEGYK